MNRMIKYSGKTIKEMTLGEFILPIGLAIITGYWLLENNNTIKNEKNSI